jgi:4-phospho-D-threonate 3-dehydrogenase / 4-phospho-D-erythronate 3-dehydrogenase
MTRPTIAISMGDPAGIGPEVIMKALANLETRAICNALVIGDANRLRKAGKIVGGRLEIAALREADDADFDSGSVQCVDLNLVPDDLPFGKMSATAGEAAYRFIEKAVQVVQAGSAQAICTAPLSKEALHAAGHKYPGHTELLAHLTGTPEVSMMLVSNRLRVIHVTTHIGLLDAIEKIEPGLVERVIVRGHEVLVRAGLTNPKIGVCAINPHAGENGLLGYSAEARRQRKSRPPSRPVNAEVGMCKALCLPIRSFSWLAAAITTWSLRCTMIRAMARSRYWDWRPALTSRSACR